MTSEFALLSYLLRTHFHNIYLSVGVSCFCYQGTFVHISSWALPVCVFQHSASVWQGQSSLCFWWDMPLGGLQLSYQHVMTLMRVFLVFLIERFSIAGLKAEIVITAASKTWEYIWKPYSPHVNVCPASTTFMKGFVKQLNLNVDFRHGTPYCKRTISFVKNFEKFLYFLRES